ncbi:cystathionine gamma-lyase [Candidatus Kryptonium thompsonii]|jgi:cystathionine beta-lyase/cystathionine gamma-synthase|uniref:Cystathionine gamma-lyase n=2 Tax=Candidatus Kryptonium thompsonii TaxID=1633631 RepID=A0A0P1MXV2_9BACT|nr:aminotransferase class I/II-fold pyridoxal phosphate-dependent enzyme [Candidatus Kryptonium thompsoni]CUS76927.1 cystathionine gamma-lyase [Candidatus Kryptonium thompsoni]CUS78042.1 cystathionine gamma-lyase [Candidatus Kryptonium thompsoni]CUS83863.1 cystathionine gamma-lyase [Candidatus Kryptonium thompsoni]CUS88227.1 cystathionine gamma-lyase [Candidatus Kryptonium thompsoni]CUS88992.1 cystathionine gamma-lyase [Candidatus Kryptonium thompsoni]
MKPKFGISTIAIHGEIKDKSFRSVVYPIYQSSTFAVEKSDDYQKFIDEVEDFYIYSRYGNPTIREVEKRLALIENCDDAILFSSGMSAITTTILSLVGPGDEIISLSSIYGVTYRFFRDYIPRFKINVKFIELNQIQELKNFITEKTKLIYFETPINPTTRVVDIKEIVTQAKKYDHILTVIDNTFATPVNQNPADFGVDIILHSATKYLSGHSDLILGCVISRKEIIDKIRKVKNTLGGVPDPHQAFLLGRSLKTLELRVKKQNENALKIAEFLSNHKAVRKVLYPGLPSHPDHDIAKRQMKGFGGMLSFEIDGNLEHAKKFCDSLKIALNATSLGSVETLVSIPVLTSHIKMDENELEKAGITSALVRISVGIENVEDLLWDFDQALNSI